MIETWPQDKKKRFDAYYKEDQLNAVVASELIPNQMLRGSQIREERADFDNVIARYIKLTSEN